MELFLINISSSGKIGAMVDEITLILSATFGAEIFNHVVRNVLLTGVHQTFVARLQILLDLRLAPNKTQ